jgi:hypothetical protein
MEHRDIVESIARGMIERFGAEAILLANGEAGTVASVSDAETWNEIADAIERLSPKP